MTDRTQTPPESPETERDDLTPALSTYVTPPFLGQEEVFDKGEEE